MKKKMKVNWDKEAKNLKKLMEEGKIKLYKDMAPELRKVMFNKNTGKVEEETISPKLRELLLAIRNKGE